MYIEAQRMIVILTEQTPKRIDVQEHEEWYWRAISVLKVLYTRKGIIAGMECSHIQGVEYKAARWS